jgi:hypothetical protein
MTKEQIEELLKNERKFLQRQIENLSNQILGLDRAIELFNEDDSFDAAKFVEEQANKPQLPAKISIKGKVKEFVFSSLLKAGLEGLTTTNILEWANEQNIDLKRGTVSSLLSLLKANDAVIFDGNKYYLAKFAKEIREQKESNNE